VTRIFPPRNLPGEAEEWGRHVEDRIGLIEGINSLASQNTDNGGRFTGGQISVFSSQVSEQVDRNTIRITAPDLSVTGSGTLEPFPRATMVMPFSAPGGSRNAQIEIYAKYTLSAPGDVGLYAYLTYEGHIVSKLRNSQITNDGNPFFTPEPWMFKGLTNVRLPEDGSGSFSLTVIRVGFTGDVSTETLTGLELYITPFQRA